MVGVLRLPVPEFYLFVHEVFCLFVYLFFLCQEETALNKTEFTVQDSNPKLKVHIALGLSEQDPCLVASFRFNK